MERIFHQSGETMPRVLIEREPVGLDRDELDLRVRPLGRGVVEAGT